MARKSHCVTRIFRALSLKFAIPLQIREVTKANRVVFSATFHLIVNASNALSRSY